MILGRANSTQAVTWDTKPVGYWCFSVVPDEDTTVQEHFLGFVPVTETTGRGLTDFLGNELPKGKSCMPLSVW